MVGSAVFAEVPSSTSVNAAVRRSALEASGGGWRDVFRRTQHNRALVAGSLAQVAGYACLGIGQAGHGDPRLVLVEHAQALERADVDAVATTTANLLLDDWPGPFRAPDFLSRIAKRVEDRIVRACATARATVDADLGIDEIELFLDAVDRGDGAHGLTRRAAHAFVVDEIRHRMSPQFSIRGTSLSFPPMPLGAHVSTAGGLSTCVGRALAMGAECMQIFLSTPQRWQHPSHTAEEVQEFRRLVDEASIGPNFAHAAYLLHLASTDPGIPQRSIDNLLAYPASAGRVALAGIVSHVG